MMSVIPQGQIEQIVSEYLNKSIDNSKQDFNKEVLTQAQNIEQGIKANVPVDKGTLKASIGIIKSKKSNFFMWVGVQYSNRHSAFEGGNHGHLVEYGTKERYMKRGLMAGGYTRSSGGTLKFKGKANHAPYAGKYLGTMPQKSFIRATADQMSKGVINSLKQAVINAIKKQP